MNEQKRGRKRKGAGESRAKGASRTQGRGEGSAHGRKEGLTQARRRGRTSAKGSAGEGRERGRIFSELLLNTAISIYLIITFNLDTLPEDLVWNELATKMETLRLCETPKTSTKSDDLSFAKSANPLRKSAKTSRHGATVFGTMTTIWNYPENTL